MESSIIHFEIPTDLDLERLAPINYTQLSSSFLRHFGPDEGDYSSESNNNLLDNYGLLTLTIWIIIVFTFFAITIVFCICSCLFYNKIRKWRNENGNYNVI